VQPLPLHSPLAHEPLAQATGVLQLPVASQVWTPAPEHCVVPGTQTPVHLPATQAVPAHAMPAPQAPLAVHVSTLLPCGEHCVVPGAHEPVQAPATHASSPQSMAMPQMPVDPQTSTPLPSHCAAPGAHPGVPPSPASDALSALPSSPAESAVESAPWESTVASGVPWFASEEASS
jgi:hypothetical protein